MSRARTPAEKAERRLGWLAQTVARLARAAQPQEQPRPERLTVSRSTGHPESKRGYHPPARTESRQQRQARLALQVQRQIRIPVIHQAPGQGGLMPCCGFTPFEVPRFHQLTATPAVATCRGRS